MGVRLSKQEAISVMRDTINTKKGRSYRISTSPEETAALHEATAAFALSVEAHARPMGIKVVELALLLHETPPEQSANERVRDWGSYRPKTNDSGAVVETRKGMALDRLLRAMRNAHARYGWWDDAVLALVDKVKPVDRLALRNYGAVADSLASLASALGIAPEQVLTELAATMPLHPKHRPTKERRTVDADGNHVLASAS